MFRTIVLAILFVEVGIPLIIALFSDSEGGTVGCIIFAIVIALLLIIL